MFNKLVDVLKEVFWLKRKASKTVRKKATPKKAPAKRKVAAIPKAKACVPKIVAPKPIKVKVSKVPKKKEVVIDPALNEIGEITHYFERIKVCVVKLTHGALLIGDRLHVIGAHTRFVQKVWSMQIESLDVKVAKSGQLVGLKVEKPVQVGDKVYK